MRHNREDGANPSWTRRCNWGCSHDMSLTILFGWEDVGKQMNQKPEDLPELNAFFLLRGLGSQGA